MNSVEGFSKDIPRVLVCFNECVVGYVIWSSGSFLVFYDCSYFLWVYLIWFLLVFLMLFGVFFFCFGVFCPGLIFWSLVFCYVFLSFLGFREGGSFFCYGCIALLVVGSGSFSGVPYGVSFDSGHVCDLLYFFFSLFVFVFFRGCSSMAVSFGLQCIPWGLFYFFSVRFSLMFFGTWLCFPFCSPWLLFLCRLVSVLCLFLFSSFLLFSSLYQWLLFQIRVFLVS